MGKISDPGNYEVRSRRCFLEMRVLGKWNCEVVLNSLHTKRQEKPGCHAIFIISSFEAFSQPEGPLPWPLKAAFLTQLPVPRLGELEKRSPLLPGTSRTNKTGKKSPDLPT